MDLKTDQKWLARAIEVSRLSSEPVACGAVIVRHDKVIAEECNSQQTDSMTVNHAEIKAIISANRALKSRKLDNCTVYCSCEPCAMCLAALSYAKIERIVFNKSMKDLFPADRQSQMDPYYFVKQLNFTPKLSQLSLKY